MKIRLLPLLILVFSYVSATPEQTRMEVFQGNQIRPYVDAMAKLAAITFREPPYLYEGTIEGYRPFFQNYANTDNAIACLLFDGNQLVGMASGVSLDRARQFYQQPFSNKGFDIRSIYNLGELLVLKEYRGRGYGPDMYKKFENVVKSMSRFQAITFCTYPDNWSIKNNLEDTDEAFWKSQGFVENRNIFVILYWVNMGQRYPTAHKLFFWIKPLK